MSGKKPRWVEVTQRCLDCGDAVDPLSARRLRIGTTVTIHVDDMQRPARVGRIDGVWSHLAPDLPSDGGTIELPTFLTRSSKEEH